MSAAQAGFTPAEGVELNPWLVLYSKVQAIRQGLSSATSFHRKDLWKFSLKPYPNIVIFGVEEMVTCLTPSGITINFNLCVCVIFNLFEIADGGIGVKIRK